MSSPSPLVYFVLIYNPGPTWQKGLSFDRQPGIEEHIGYMAGHLNDGCIVFGGPFLDGQGSIGVLRAVTLKEAEQIAAGDPAVQGGLLQVLVRPLLVTMSSLD
jgi:uncharacterized protein YciI